VVKKVVARGSGETIRELEKKLHGKPYPVTSEFIPEGPASMTIYVPDEML